MHGDGCFGGVVGVGVIGVGVIGVGVISVGVIGVFVRVFTIMVLVWAF